MKPQTQLTLVSLLKFSVSKGGRTKPGCFCKSQPPTQSPLKIKKHDACLRTAQKGPRNSNMQRRKLCLLRFQGPLNKGSSSVTATILCCLPWQLLAWSSVFQTTGFRLKLPGRNESPLLWFCHRLWSLGLLNGTWSAKTQLCADRTPRGQTQQLAQPLGQAPNLAPVAASR